jgi:hypothetical protein
MITYSNLSSSSGVTAFKAGKDYIVVAFADDVYLYTYASAGKSHIEKMKQLAEAGRGLGTYISRHVREHYEKKL